jgi:NAD(P)-dependent dehydrogenase (short-subunit alcohol dehydrogenase family)
VVRALRGCADIPLAAYASAKAGLWAATQNLAKELAPHQILVNAITPGSTITEERLKMFCDGTFASGQVPAGAAATQRLVYTSSAAAYGYHSDNPVPITEDVPPRGSP